MQRLPIVIVTVLLLLGAQASSSAAGGWRGKRAATRPTGARARVHKTTAGRKQTKVLDADYDALVRDGGRLRYDGAGMARWARGHVRQQGNGLASSYLRDSPSNRFSVVMRPEGVTVIARITDIAPAQRKTTRTSFHTVRRDPQNPRRELHAFELAADRTVSMKTVRTMALARYRRTHPEAVSSLVPSREQLVVRPDGTQRLTISFDPSRPTAHLPLD